MTVLLHMGDIRKGVGVIVHIDSKRKRRLLHRVTGRDPVNIKMSTETVNFILHSRLKSLHHQKGNDHGSQTNRNADDGNTVDDRRKSCCRGSYSSGNECRKLQFYAIDFER